MLRKIGLCTAALLLLAGCDKPGGKDENVVHMQMPMPTNAAPAMYAPPPPFVPPPDFVINTNAPGLFSLQHSLTLVMQREAVTARFAAMRDTCLKDRALHCVLTSASISAGDTVSAELQVALPHEQVAVFEKLLSKPLKEDADGKVEITSRSTSTENQTQSAADIDRTLSQAKAYRDQLEDLSKRANLSVDEVLKIHEALVQAQDAVNNAEAAKRASDSKIVLEQMTVSLRARVIAPGPFEGFWANASDVIVASSADMLLRLINVIPWLPLAAVMAWIVARLMNRWQIRRGRTE